LHSFHRMKAIWVQIIHLDFFPKFKRRCHGNQFCKKWQNRSSGPDIIILREIIKKDKKKKEIAESKIYSPVGNLVKWAKQIKPIMWNKWLTQRMPLTCSQQAKQHIQYKIYNIKFLTSYISPFQTNIV